MGLEHVTQGVKHPLTRTMARSKITGSLGDRWLAHGLKNRPESSALQASAVLDEQSHNQHRSQNPNHLHGGNIQPFPFGQPLLLPHVSPSSPSHPAWPPRRCLRHGLGCLEPSLGVGRWRWRGGALVFWPNRWHGAVPTRLPLFCGDRLGRPRAWRQPHRRTLRQNPGHAQGVHPTKPPFALFVDGQNRLWSGDGAGMVGMWSRDGHTLRLEQQWRTNLGKIRHLSPHPEGL